MAAQITLRGPPFPLARSSRLATASTAFSARNGTRRCAGTADARPPGPSLSARLSPFRHHRRSLACVASLPGGCGQGFGTGRPGAAGRRGSGAPCRFRLPRVGNRCGDSHMPGLPSSEIRGWGQVCMVTGCRRCAGMADARPPGSSLSALLSPFRHHRRSPACVSLLAGRMRAGIRHRAPRCRRTPGIRRPVSIPAGSCREPLRRQPYAGAALFGNPRMGTSLRGHGMQVMRRHGRGAATRIIPFGPPFPFRHHRRAPACVASLTGTGRGRRRTDRALRPQPASSRRYEILAGRAGRRLPKTKTGDSPDSRGPAARLAPARPLRRQPPRLPVPGRYDLAGRAIQTGGFPWSVPISP